MGKSIKSNLIYNLINSISALLFPLITFPYVSRVLMADGIGLIQFYDSIIGYVVLLTGLGIPMYGIREIARVREDAKKTSITAIEIIILNLIFTIFGYFVILVFSFSVEAIKENIHIFLILSLTLGLTTIGCPWFYSGIEDFKYVTIRALIVRIICTIGLFMFVKTKNDLIYYALYQVGVSALNNLWNFARLRKYIYVDKSLWHSIKPFRHLRPALKIFAFNLITSIYTRIDSVMLGFIKGPESVGLYTAANKIVHMVLTGVFALGQIMLPRLSNLIANNNQEEFGRLATKAYRFTLFICLPMFMGIFVLASPLIHLFSGASFEPAIPTIRSLSIVIVAIGISNLFGLQILYPLGKVGIVNKSVFVGALVNVTLNSLLIPIYSHGGAAVATVCAEVSVVVVQLFLARKLIPINLLSESYLVYVFASLFMFIICFAFINIIKTDAIIIFVVPVIGVIIYIVTLWMFNEPLTKEIISNMTRRINKK